MAGTCLHVSLVPIALTRLRTRAPRFYAVAFLSVIFLFWSGWFCIISFPPNTNEGAEVMPDIVEAMWQLLILLTTANFPDVMLPAYTDNRCDAMGGSCS